MSVEVSLLGRPRAARDGEAVTLRGRKVWLLLAFLLLEGAVSRDRLARMMFIDAADPQAALRWNLSQLRRCLDLQLTGDPVTLVVPQHVTVDVRIVVRGDAERAAAMSGLDEDLLAGIRPEDASEIAMWLDDERRHLRRVGIDVREEAALICLGRGDIDEALGLARQVAEALPLDEDAAVLLVRCLRAAGDLAAAHTTAERTAALLRSELGVEPSGQLWAAAQSPTGAERRVTGPGAVVAQLDAGVSAVAAGATDTGVAALRSAVIAARAIEEPALVARTLVALGSAMIHGIRGTDHEGLALLHEAVALTAGSDDHPSGVRARREIGYVDFLRGRYDRALHWFDQARTTDGDGASESGWIDAYEGTSRDDIGDREGAATTLDRALRHAQRHEDPRLETYALALLGRHHLMGHDLDRARATLDAALQLAGTIGWTGFRPWPEALLADVLRLDGDLDRARTLAEQSFVLAEQVGDPCWEAAALRSLGLVTVDAGDLDGGLALLHEVPTVCRRLPDTYRWVELWGYDALIQVGRHHGLADTRTWVDRLSRQASAIGARPLVERARAGHQE